MENKKTISACYHYSRVEVDWEKGKEENRPKEEERGCIESAFLEKMLGDVPKHYMVKKSNLNPISDMECKCTECKQIFSIEKIKQMEKLFGRMNELADMDEGTKCFLDLEFLKLQEGLEPVWYRKKDDGGVEFLRKQSPRDWPSVHINRDLFQDEMIGDNYLKDEAVNLFCNIPEYEDGVRKNVEVCNHYVGMAYCILKNRAYPDLPRFVGGATSKLVTDEAGICKCCMCHKVFSEEEQVQMERLIAYLNTPHYCTEEEMSHHKEWQDVLAFYDEGYLEENEAYQLFNLEKALELSKGIEPVMFYCKNFLKEEYKRKILCSLKWKDNAWKAETGLFHYIWMMIKASL